MDREHGRALIAEATARGWVVVENPSPALKEMARRAVKGDVEAKNAISQLGTRAIGEDISNAPTTR